ncbi:MAG: O-antigen ligase family protein [Candidatus Coproplasma sp.]
MTALNVKTLKKANTKNGKRVSDIISKLLVLLLFFVLLFVSSDDTKTHGSIYVFHVNANAYYFVFGLVTIGLIVSIISRGISYDRITFLLVIRFVLFTFFAFLLYLVGAFDTEFQIGILLAYYCCVAAYLCGKNGIEQNWLCKILFISLVIILLQLIATFIGRGLSFSDVNSMKWYMVIPLGQTNTIGCYVIGIMIYLCSFYRKNLIRIATIIISLLIILLTYSRASLLVFAIYIAYFIVKIILSSNNRGIKTIIILLVFTVLIALLITFSMQFDILGRFTFDSLTSSRFQVYKEGFELFFKYPITGVGAYSFKIYDSVKAHNWILESLIESGIIISCIYFAVLYFLYKKIKFKNKKMLVFLVFYLIHGLVEPNLFTINLDCFFWLLAATCVYGNREKGNINEKIISNNRILSKRANTP